MKHFVRYIISFLMAFALTACYEELLEDEAIGEGRAVISATIDFKPMSSALTRADGNALGDIGSLYVLVYDSQTKELVDGGKWKINDYTVSDEIPRDDADADNGHTAETATKSASFTLPAEINFGKYYMYAVANIPDLLENKDYEESIKTVDGLKNLQLKWNTGDLSANGQMFGFFTKASDSSGAADESVELNEKTVKLHAWMRRAASKVTVAFDGSNLKDGVSIRIKSVRIKNIPASCLLGAENTAGEGGLIDGEEVNYSGDDDAFVTNEVRYFPRKQVAGEGGSVSWVKHPDSHSETNPHSLFFYENRQGAGDDMPDKRQTDVNGDGILDGLYPYAEMPYATFIEVDTYYESSNPERPGISNITYRFMLGQDVIKDYNATRNCHYKLTLNFKNFANEADWRIDYVTRLWATQPETVDYRGKYFEPDNTSNHGHLFKNDNSITVTSFMYDRDDWNNSSEQKYKIEFRDAGDTEFTDKCPDWLGISKETDDGKGTHKWKIDYKNKFKDYHINDTLLNNDQKEGIYDLATKGGSGKMNTANCYIVDSKGTYRFPLVYGNAIVDDNENDDSYTYGGGRTGIHYLQVFKNYNDQPVKSAYILDDIYGSAENAPSGLSASLLWQDEKNLIKPESVSYVPPGNGRKGEIQFEIGDIKEGNAVIALRDATAEKVIIWSWHIWVTSLDLSKNITIHRPSGELHLPERDFEIMPVNLGWCSGGIPVRYYDRHECEVRFTQVLDDGHEGLSKTVTIVQEPHVAVPMGNNPYFQWGRKDPFIAGDNTDGSNKTWYDANGDDKNSAPELMYATDAERVKTFDATAKLIRNPHKWQNCPRKPNGSGYLPKDSIFFNLWDNSFWDGDDNVVKTIYDPCPAGYHVSSVYTFNGFTDSGQNIGLWDGSIDIKPNMYAVTDENMMQEGNYKNGIYEFYTDSTKLISLGFPQNGYRDWDANAGIYTMNTIGQVWSAQTIPWDWALATPYNAYYFKYSRNTFINPWDNYFATDGFPVRPTME